MFMLRVARPGTQGRNLTAGTPVFQVRRDKRSKWRASREGQVKKTVMRAVKCGDRWRRLRGVTSKERRRYLMTLKRGSNRIRKREKRRKKRNRNGER